jgi:hypothetical protein
MSWAPAGQSVAVGYGSPSHTDFCDHMSCIAMWNVMRGAALRPTKTVTAKTRDAAVIGGSAGDSGGGGNGGDGDDDGSGGGGGGKSSKRGSKSDAAGSEARAKAVAAAAAAVGGASAASAPDFAVEISACVTALAFHPSDPSLFVAGTFHGEVILYSMDRLADTSGSVDPVISGCFFFFDFLQIFVCFFFFLSCPVQLMIFIPPQPGPR